MTDIVTQLSAELDRALLVVSQVLGGTVKGF